MLIGGRHTGIPVKNMGISRGFYQDLLGFRPKVDEIEEGFYIDTISGFSGIKLHVVKLIAPDGWMIELLQYISHPSEPRHDPRLDDIGHAHVALTVDNVDAEFERLTASGVPFNSRPQISPNGYAKVAFCQDPDGNFVELVEVL